jgi:hypothetical protein
VQSILKQVGNFFWALCHKNSSFILMVSMRPSS